MVAQERKKVDENKDKNKYIWKLRKQCQKQPISYNEGRKQRDFTEDSTYIPPTVPKNAASTLAGESITAKGSKKEIGCIDLREV